MEKSHEVAQGAQAGDERAAFESAMVAEGYHKPERGLYPDSQYLYQRDQDRFVGWMARAALATQPAAGEPAARVLSSRAGNDTSTIDKALPDGTKLFLAPPAAAHGDEAGRWVECSERLPKSGSPVLAFYTNRAGKGRRIRANYVAPKSHEVDFADPDTQCVEYDEETDCFYLQAGWYELIDNWEEYSSIAVIEGEISHWMTLPTQPAMRAQGDGESV